MQPGKTRRKVGKDIGG